MRIGQLGAVVLQVVAGVAAAIDLLEAVAALLGGLHQEANAVLAVAADPGVAQRGVVGAEHQAGLAGQLGLRNRGGDQVDRATSGARPVLDRGGSLDDLDRAHARGGGKVVGRRRGVGRRRDQHAVLHDGDAAVAVDARATDTDVRAQAEAFLFHHVHARCLAQDALDVGVFEVLQLFLADVLCGAADFARSFGAADDLDAVQRGGVGQRRDLRVGRQTLKGQGNGGTEHAGMTKAG